MQTVVRYVGYSSSTTNKLHRNVALLEDPKRSAVPCHLHVRSVPCARHWRQVHHHLLQHSEPCASLQVSQQVRVCLNTTRLVVEYILRVQLGGIRLLIQHQVQHTRGSFHGSGLIRPGRSTYLTAYLYGLHDNPSTIAVLNTSPWRGGEQRVQCRRIQLGTSRISSRCQRRRSFRRIEELEFTIKETRRARICTLVRSRCTHTLACTWVSATAWALSDILIHTGHFPRFDALLRVLLRFYGVAVI